MLTMVLAHVCKGLRLAEHAVLERVGARGCHLVQYTQRNAESVLDPVAQRSEDERGRGMFRKAFVRKSDRNSQKSDTALAWTQSPPALGNI